MAAAILLPGSASAGEARVITSTKLHRCVDQTCLLIYGRQTDPEASILVEHHQVAVAGRRRWHVSLPLQTAQDWVLPSARSISIEIAGKDGGAVQALPPIGVLGGTTNLAFRNVSAS